MTRSRLMNGRVALACGGTGGHLFPGVAVAAQLAEWGCESRLMTSEKEIDRIARDSAPGLEFLPIGGSGWVAGGRCKAVAGAWKGFRQVRGLFESWRPDVVLSMGGFAGVAPVLTASAMRIPVVLHEANAVPGRATRWLSWFAQSVLTGFEETTRLLDHASIKFTGMPVRPSLGTLSAGPARRELGLDPARPVLLVMGGSQGALAINDLFLGVRGRLDSVWPGLQVIHLTGPGDFERVRQNGAPSGLNLVTLPFEARMDKVLAAATVVVSRAGASSIAEFVACGLPSLLIPYPLAADDHQRHNAEAMVKVGGARMLCQAQATPARLLGEISALRSEGVRASMGEALRRFPGRDAAEQVARRVLNAAGLEELGSMEFPRAPKSPDSVNERCRQEVVR